LSRAAPYYVAGMLSVPLVMATVPPVTMLTVLRLIVAPLVPTSQSQTTVVPSLWNMRANEAVPVASADESDVMVPNVNVPLAEAEPAGTQWQRCEQRIAAQRRVGVRGLRARIDGNAAARQVRANSVHHRVPRRCRVA
jgi:hypothetical protein